MFFPTPNLKKNIFVIKKKTLKISKWIQKSKISDTPPIFESISSLHIANSVVNPDTNPFTNIIANTFFVKSIYDLAYLLMD